MLRFGITNMIVSQNHFRCFTIRNRKAIAIRCKGDDNSQNDERQRRSLLQKLRWKTMDPDLDAWQRLQLSISVLSIHATLSIGSVSLLASLIGKSVSNLSIFEISGFGLLGEGLQLFLIDRLTNQCLQMWKRPKKLLKYRWTKQNVVIGICCGISIAILSTSYSLWINSRGRSIGEAILYNSNDSLAKGMEVLNATIVTPITEEVVHRGILFRCLITSQKSVLSSLVFSSILFAFLHFSWYAFPFHFISGLIFGIATVLSHGDLVTPIIAHSVSNTIAVVLSFL